MVFSGISPDGKLVEIAELADHPFMLGTQFHPEFLSRPNRPHPLFVAFIQAVAERTKSHRSQTFLTEPISEPGDGQNTISTPKRVSTE